MGGAGQVTSWSSSEQYSGGNGGVTSWSSSTQGGGQQGQQSGSWSTQQ
jgi:hypothetical protein